MFLIQTPKGGILEMFTIITAKQSGRIRGSPVTAFSTPHLFLS